MNKVICTFLFSVFAHNPHGSLYKWWNNWPSTPPPTLTTRGNRTFLLLARATEEMEQYTSEITRGGHHSKGFLLVLATFKKWGRNVKIPFLSPSCKEWSQSRPLTEFFWEMLLFHSRKTHFVSTQNVILKKCSLTKLTFSDGVDSRGSDFRSAYLMMHRAILFRKYVLWRN